MLVVIWVCIVLVYSAFMSFPEQDTKKKKKKKSSHVVLAECFFFRKIYLMLSIVHMM